MQQPMWLKVQVGHVSEFFAQYGSLLGQGTIDSIAMTLGATLFAYLLGVPIGVAVVVTDADGLRPNRGVNMVLGWIVNIGRSIPFIILLVALIPFTRLLVGTSLGIKGALVPLVVASAPFVGRMVEQSLKEVDPGLIEAALSFGASTWQIIYKVLLKEALPSLIRGFAITAIAVFGYTAMAGTVGAGGLGDIAIRYGYQRYQTDIMIATILISIVLVQLIQSTGDFTARKLDKRNR